MYRDDEELLSVMCVLLGLAISVVLLPSGEISFSEEFRQAISIKQLEELRSIGQEKADLTSPDFHRRLARVSNLSQKTSLIQRIKNKCQSSKILYFEGKNKKVICENGLIFERVVDKFSLRYTSTVSVDDGEERILLISQKCSRLKSLYDCELDVLFK